MRFRIFTTALIALIAAVVLPIGTAAQRGGRGGQVNLPDGPAKTMVEGSCASCHSLAMIPGSAGYTRDGWQALIATMVALPKDQSEAITTYLATHFPVKPERQPKLVAGPVAVNIREWIVPTLGSRPHDPLAARDGSIWWTGQYTHRLGRVDPKTGAMKEFPLPNPTGPHGLDEDRDGNVWFTGIEANYIGKLDPKTGSVTQFPVQKAEPASRGPHTPVFDQKGNLWFTMQSGHVGRLIPSSGDMKIVPAPSGAGMTYPYGIQVDSQGVPWYVDFRGPRIASIDPATMAIKEITLPNAESRPRRIAITSDDVIWYTDYSRGFLGRYDPKTATFKEYASPSGPQSQPYGIATVGTIVWYNESFPRPNTMVRFDPATEKFQTWIIPSGGGVVRNMMRTADGNLALANSGVNRVALVEIKK